MGGAAVLLQIPYSLDELLTTCQFLRRRVKAGQPWLRVLFRGDHTATAMAVVLGLALMVLSLRRGPIQERYGPWNRLLV